ncbi:helix-turn-helix domain-containing protein [Kallotenue papyrolyticum]|uniref:helix-turn-helix domain-containing protein n=1 Tax=Kallotenue papyrolyticum TaxID=1325125 RepID=UPI00047250AF|nr:helix-turn-helix domain-containing protein [Kallotenue papyrolyticum]
MSDREQRLIEAAMRYRALLAGPEPISIREFVAGADPDLRDELAEYLELLLLTPEPTEPIRLSPDEQALAARVAERARQRFLQRLMTLAPAQSLTALRRAQRFSLNALARRINLPADLLHRIERGGVLAQSLPEKLIRALAEALQRTEAEIRAALATPPPATATRLSARDGTTVQEETPVDFVTALEQSTASEAQKAEWR